MFEKARLSATYKGDYHSPNESDIDGKYILYDSYYVNIIR